MKRLQLIDRTHPVGSRISYFVYSRSVSTAAEGWRGGSERGGERTSTFS